MSFKSRAAPDSPTGRRCADPAAMREWREMTLPLGKAWRPTLEALPWSHTASVRKRTDEHDVGGSGGSLRNDDS